MGIATEQKQSVENEECGRKCRVRKTKNEVLNEEFGRKFLIRVLKIQSAVEKGN